MHYFYSDIDSDSDIYSYHDYYEENIKDNFYFSCENGYIEHLKFMIEGCGDICIHINNNYGFEIACVNGHLNIVEYLIQVVHEKIPRKEDCRNELCVHNGLVFACYHGHLNIVDFLIKNELLKDVNKMCETSCSYKTSIQNGFINACSVGNIKIMKYLYRHCTNTIYKIHIDYIPATENVETLEFLLDKRNQYITDSSFKEYFTMNCHEESLLVNEYLLSVIYDIYLF